MMRCSPALRGSLIAGLVALFSSTSAHADAVLHPGTVTGAVGLTGFTHSNGYLQLSGNNSGYFGSTSISGPSYSLTLEGGQSYSYSYLNLYFPDSYFYLQSSATVAVPANDSVTVNFTRPGAQIDWHVDVAGGSLVSVDARASSWNGSASESYGAEAWASGTQDAHLRMVAGAGVQTSGTVSVAVTDELNSVLCTINRSLPSHVVDLTEGQVAAISDTIAVTPEMCSSGIFGTVAVNDLPGAQTWDYGYIWASGPVYRSQQLAQNPSTYALEGLQPGSYYVSSQLYYGGPYQSWLTLPSQTPSEYVDEGQSVTHDLVREGGAATGAITLKGSAAKDASSAYTYFYGAWGTDAQNGYSQSNTAMTGGGVGSYQVALTEGTWYAGNTYVYFYSPNGYAQLGVNDYNPQPVVVSAGQSVTGPEMAVEAAAGEIVFDVVEPQGAPVVGISSPSINAYRYDPVANRYYYLYASSYVSNAATPSVKLIGPPGVYHFDAYATVNGSYARFASSTIELGQSVNTPTGEHVTVTPKDGSGAELPIDLSFGNITGGGETSVSVTDQGPAAPADSDILKVVSDKSFINVTSSADFEGKVEIAIDYDPVELNLTAAQEKQLQLQQYVCDAQQSCHWELINETYNNGDAHSIGNSAPAAGNPDTAGHRLYGVTDTLSIFAITLPNVTLVPPTGTCVGSSAAPAQLQTDPGTCTASIDNANQRAGGCEGGGGGLLSCTFDGAASEALAPGAHEVAIVGTANDTSTASCTSFVSVVDREAPSVQCPAPVTVECAGALTARPVSASCTENCGSCNATCGAGPFPLGQTPVSCNAQDASGNGSSCQTKVTVVDTIAPTLTVSVSPATLTTPNHKLKPISIAYSAADVCDSAVKVSCAATSNEPDNGLGDGDTSGDITWQNGALFLRAERSGTGSGRVYTVTCTATDASGNHTSTSATVTVPK